VDGLAPQAAMGGCSWLVCLVALPTVQSGSEAPVVVREAIQVGHLERVFHVQYPVGTAPPTGWPLVFSFHGWLGDADGMSQYDRLRLYGTSSAIVVHGEGYSDPAHPGSRPRWMWQSWNGAGSSGVEANGTDGPICKPEAVADGGWQCYESCKVKGYCTVRGLGAERCHWSHCEDDVAFTIAMVEHIKAQALAAVDASRIYATGHSNGGQFVYELASDPRSAGIFAAVAAVSGLPHNGFNRGTPNTKMRFLDIGGTMDTFVWHFPNVEGDGTKSYGTCCGWYYSNWRNTTSLWVSQKGLAESGRTPITTKYESILACEGWGSDGTVESMEVGICFYSGLHESPAVVFSLVWDFFGIPVTGGQESGFSLTLLLGSVLALGSLLVLCYYATCNSREKVSAD